MATRRPAGSRKRNYKAEYARRKAGMAKRGITRDYKREYQRRLELKRERLLEELHELAERDAKRVFGVIPKRDEDHPDPISYEDYLKDRQKREERDFKWTDERSFVDSITGLGLTEKEAYTLWFSP